MSTYQKNGHLHGHFNSYRNSIFDKLGREAAIDFWKQFGWEAQVNDRDESDNLLYNNTDLKVCKQNKFINIEAASKRANLFRFVRDGVDIETRKLKMTKTGQKSFVCMSDYIKNPVYKSGTEMLLVPMECLIAAQNDCGDSYKGQRDIESSSNFIMPEHGCHRVRKRCYEGIQQTGHAEDFYRIPYAYVAHYRRNDAGLYEQLHKPERKLNNG